MNELPITIEKNVPQSHLVKIWVGKPRPTLHHELVTEAVVETMFPKIVKWLGDSYRPSESESIRAELRKLFNGYEMDGYALAKKLDSWNPDAELVDVLENSGWIAMNARDALIITWAAENREMLDALYAKFPEGRHAIYQNGVGTVTSHRLAVNYMGTVTLSIGLSNYIVPLEQLQEV